MGSKESFEVEFTEKAIIELEEIYQYISIKLSANESAKKLVKKIKKIILNLSNSPYMYMKIKTANKLLKNEYRRIIVDKFIILYTIDEKHKRVFISHVYYSRKNYI